MDGGKKYHANTNQKKAGIAILSSDLADFKNQENISEIKKRIMMKESAPQEGMAILNLYAPSNTASNYVRQN